MKALITFLTFIIPINLLFGQQNIYEVKYREKFTDTITWPNHKKYSFDADKNRFVSIFIKSSHPIDAELQDSTGKYLTKFSPIEWLINMYYIEYDAKFNGPYFISIKSFDSVKATEVNIHYLVNIPSSDRILKDSTKIDNAIFADCYYNFKLAEDRIISIGPSSDLGASGKLTYLDTKTNRLGIMYPLNDSAFYSPYSFIDSYSDDNKITFHRSGSKITSISWEDNSGTVNKAPLIYPSVVEDVDFYNGEIKLSGILITPEGNGPFPLVVFTHGSGAALRDQGFFLSYFTRFGFAVLSFDKRGAGKSTGDWVISSFDDLADDIIKGIEFVKKTKSIDTAKVGLFGISQGGWVGAIAASKSSSIKFLIINTGSGVSVNKNMTYEFESTIREQGDYTESETSEISTFYYELLEKASNGLPYDTIQKYISEKKGKNWLPLVPLANLPEKARWWKWQELNGHYDNSIMASKLKCPVLWVLADNDKNVPFEISKTGIEKAIISSGNSEFTLQYFSPATHVMVESTSGYLSNVAISERKFVQGYWQLMNQWITNYLSN